MVAPETVVALVFLVGLVLLRNKKKLNHIPGPKGFPIIGTILSGNGEHMFLKIQKLTKEFGKIFCCTIFRQKVVVVNDVSLMKKLSMTEEYRGSVDQRPPSIISEYLLKHDILANSNTVEHQALKKIFYRALFLYGDGVTKFENIVGEELAILSSTISKQNGNFPFTVYIKDSLSNLMSILVSIHIDYVLLRRELVY